jgi:AbrB family looped-hinge helix DNA binding protein
MNTTKVTSQGTISLPAAIRRKFNVKPGDTLTVSEKAGDIVISKTPSLEILHELAKPYLKNYDLKNYKNGDGWTAHVMEKYGKK